MLSESIMDIQGTVICTGARHTHQETRDKEKTDPHARAHPKQKNASVQGSRRRGLTGLVAADAVNDLETKGRAALDAVIESSTTCSKDKLKVRREWGDISTTERKAYLDGVLCLLNTPSKLDPARYPGAKNRYDDFVVVHMNQTLSIHGTGNFLVWHRYYVWAWENVMRTECGYEGTQPYWDYGRWAEDPLSSPLFDGSETSLGGNGAP
ncbi:unnamed protein product [Parascedosporium putredinis]|uniref:Tyrosinase copper-binding domain-containing protein n=1 Tax=Parascedosporium putredinis TaxID=1442378 RepID=A0A9P1MCA4_9PEZI|nr:unnamed protein product [Parascedosporium putredinis]CAI7996182.1 unnamed protein product [Parascedosporium putredinis]